MKITVLCSDEMHPIFPLLAKWAERQRTSHEVDLLRRRDQLKGGDLLFLISCHEIIGQDFRKLFKASLVIHASNLPLGRGWSPHVWQILEGRSEITVSLIEAEDAVDSGPIWAQKTMHLEGHELADEINAILFRLELELMDYAVENFGNVVPRPQDTREAIYYRKRTPEDSKIDPEKSISEQFDLLRVADQERYPTFFEIRGHRYIIKLHKIGEHNE